MAVLAIAVAGCGPPGKYGSADITLDGAPAVSAAGFVAYDVGDSSFSGWTIELAAAPAGTACNGTFFSPGMIGQVRIDMGQRPNDPEVAVPPGDVPLSASFQANCVFPQCASLSFAADAFVSGTLTIDSFSSDHDHLTGSITATLATAQDPSATLAGTFAAQRCL